MCSRKIRDSSMILASQTSFAIKCLPNGNICYWRHFSHIALSTMKRTQSWWSTFNRFFNDLITNRRFIGEPLLENWQIFHSNHWMSLTFSFIVLMFNVCVFQHVWCSWYHFYVYFELNMIWNCFPMIQIKSIRDKWMCTLHGVQRTAHSNTNQES